MTNHQQFVTKTLFDLHRDEFINTLRYKGPAKAYDLLDNHWTEHAMTVIGRNICKFHELYVNQEQLQESVEHVIAQLSDEMYDWISVRNHLYGDC